MTCQFATMLVAAWSCVGAVMHLEVKETTRRDESAREAKVVEAIARIAVLSREELVERWLMRFGLEPPKGCGRRQNLNGTINRLLNGMNLPAVQSQEFAKTLMIFEEIPDRGNDDCFELLAG